MIINQVASGGGTVTLTGNAVEADVLAGKTFYSNDPNTQLTGTGGIAGPPTPYAPVSSGSATVTADATAHTKGAWTELIASTAADATAIIVTVTDIATVSTNTACLIDFALGAAASESAVAQDIAVGGAALAGSGFIEFPLPLAIPAGSRISCRMQSAVSSKTATVSISVVSGGPITSPPSTLVTMGTSTATSAGTTANTSGWTQVTASTPGDYQGLILIPSLSTSSAAAASSRVVLASGGAGSEVEIGNVNVVTSSAESVVTSSGGAAWLFDAPAAGTRLAVRRESGFCSATVLGVPV